MGWGIGTKILNSVGKMFKADDEIAISALITEDVFHYAVHEGVAYSVWSIATSGDRFICFKTQLQSAVNTNLHLLWKFSQELNATFSVMRDVTPQSGGSDMVAQNKNHTFSNASLVKAGNTETVGSVQVGQNWTGGVETYAEFASRRGGSGAADGEIFLDFDTWYGVKLVDTGTGDIGMTLTWFEVPNA